jgi:elongation factor G
MTAIDDDNTRKEAMDAGCVAYLRKPFAPQLLLDAIGKARPQVLEPIVDLEVSAPEQHMGDISGGLSSKRARINGTDAQRGEIVVRAQVPLSELEGYAAELKSVTAGRGRYALDFSHYEPVPAPMQQKLVDAFKPRHEDD